MQVVGVQSLRRLRCAQPVERMKRNKRKSDWSDAVLNGDLRLVKSIYESYPEIIDEKCGTYEQSALMIAVANGYLDMTRFLLKRGIELDAVDCSTGWNALSLALYGIKKTEKGERDIAKKILGLLVREIVSRKEFHIVEGNLGEYMNPVLHEAIRMGEPELVDLFLLNGVDVNKADKYGNTALMIAVAENDVKTIKKLFHAGADPTLKNDAGLNALEIVVGQSEDVGTSERKEAARLVELWIENYGEILESRNLARKSVKGEASSSDKERYEELLKNGVVETFYMYDKKKRDSFSYLVLSGNVKAVERELEKRPLLFKNMIGVRLMIKSAAAGNIEMVKLTLDNGLSVNDSPSYTNDYCAILKVARHGNIEMLKFLFERGANVNVRDYNGATPVYISALMGHSEATAFLIEKGADTTIKNKYGISVVDIIKDSEKMDNETKMELLEKIKTSEKIRELRYLSLSEPENCFHR